jgi:hypothetical protein
VTATSLSFLEWVLWLLATIAEIGLAGRLFLLKLHWVYRFFFAYLVFSSCRSLALWPFRSNPSVYSWIWKLTEPALWILYVLVVLELYSLVFQNYRGIYSLGRWTVFAALVLSVVASVLSFMPTWGRSARLKISLEYFITIDRAICFSLVIFLLLIVAFLAWYPVPLSRNLIIHAIVYAVFFTSSTMGFLILNLAGYGIHRLVSPFLVGLTAVCFLTWLVLLSRGGEVKTAVLRSDWAPSDEKRLIEQLNTLNSTLIRVARK